VCGVYFTPVIFQMLCFQIVSTATAWQWHHLGGREGGNRVDGYGVPQVATKIYARESTKHHVIRFLLLGNISTERIKMSTRGGVNSRT
jgi:hypothetical protein